MGTATTVQCGAALYPKVTTTGWCVSCFRPSHFALNTEYLCSARPSLGIRPGGSNIYSQEIAPTQAVHLETDTGPEESRKDTDWGLGRSFHLTIPLCPYFSLIRFPHKKPHIYIRSPGPWTTLRINGHGIGSCVGLCTLRLCRRSRSGWSCAHLSLRRVFSDYG